MNGLGKLLRPEAGRLTVNRLTDKRARYARALPHIKHIRIQMLNRRLLLRHAMGEQVADRHHAVQAARVDDGEMAHAAT